MKDPVRLLDGGASELERALLHAGAAEEPPAGGASGVLVALGLTAGLTASAGASASESMRASAQLGAPALGYGAKWAVLAGGGMVLAALSWAGYAALSGAAPSERLTPSPTPTPSLIPSPTPSPSLTPRPIPTPSLVPGPSAGPSPVRAPSAGEARDSAAPQAEARSIAGEIAALDRARRALASGDAGAALGGLDRYRADFPRGVLQQEASVLRIEALWRAGQRARARELTRAFERAHPGSPHLERIRTLAADERDERTR